MSEVAAPEAQAKPRLYSRCGFCRFGGGDNPHNHCPSAIRNGDGTLVHCDCGCPRSLLKRCMTCNSRAQNDIDDTTWTCIDPAGCAARVAHSLETNPTIVQLRAIRAALEATRGADEDADAQAARRVVRASRKGTETPSHATSGTCTCCGGPTKGGKFQPGHDSRYLSLLVEMYKGGDETARDAAAGVSPAYLAKFEKRVS